MSLITLLSVADLDRTVAGKEYNFRYLIEGITQHDVYHLGQIALTLSLVKIEKDNE